MDAPEATDFDQLDYSFDSPDFQLTLEDSFLLTRIQNELKAATDIEQVRHGAALLLNLAVMRQAMIRGLIKRVGALEQAGMQPRPAD